jgi:hypothetical protein
MRVITGCSCGKYFVKRKAFLTKVQMHSTSFLMILNCYKKFGNTNFCRIKITNHSLLYVVAMLVMIITDAVDEGYFSKQSGSSTPIIDPSTFAQVVNRKLTEKSINKANQVLTKLQAS